MITMTRIPIISCRRGYYLRWYYNGWHVWNFLSGTIGYFTTGEKYKTFGHRTVELSSGVVDQSQINAIRTVLNAREIFNYTDFGWSECRVESGSVIVKTNRLNAYELIMKLNIPSRSGAIVPGIPPTGYGGNLTTVTVSCPASGESAITILAQNWDNTFPDSLAYDNDESNRPIYGSLYPFSTLNAAGMIPTGFRMLTIDDINSLHDMATYPPTTWSPDEPNCYPPGSYKEAGTDHWNAPNTYGYDTIGIAIRGNGWADGRDDPPTFHDLKTKSFIWYYDASKLPEKYRMMEMNYDDGNIVLNSAPYVSPEFDKLYAGVRLIKI
jgi:hypothetical protein